MSYPLLTHFFPTRLSSAPLAYPAVADELRHVRLGQRRGLDRVARPVRRDLDGAAQLAVDLDGQRDQVAHQRGGIGPRERLILQQRLRVPQRLPQRMAHVRGDRVEQRSEEHTSELQSLMRISYAVFCLKKKQHTYTTT